MTAPVYCERCEFMTHPTLPHSCFSAATLRAHTEAERAVIAAAKAYVDTPYGSEEVFKSFAAVVAAVATLRAVEGDV
jgi:hypothetical protein